MPLYWLCYRHSNQIFVPSNLALPLLMQGWVRIQEQVLYSLKPHKLYRFRIGDHYAKDKPVRDER
jgi:hypothetical protein